VRVLPKVIIRVYVKWPWLENVWLRWKFREVSRARRQREES